MFSLKLLTVLLLIAHSVQLRNVFIIIECLKAGTLLVFRYYILSFKNKQTNKQTKKLEFSINLLACKLF